MDLFQCGHSLHHSHDHGAANDTGAHQAGHLGALQGVVFGHDTGGSRSTHGSGDGAVQNGFGEDRRGIGQNDDINAIGHPFQLGVGLGFGGPLESGSVHIAADVGGHGHTIRIPVFIAGHTHKDLGGIDDLILTDHFEGFFGFGQHHLHIQQPGLDHIFLLEKKNFRFHFIASSLWGFVSLC